nr:MFS transporter [uncultured Mucilaginibacter sp.]
MLKKSTEHRTPRQLRLANAVFFFLSGLGFATWASRIPDIQKQFNLNEAELGGILLATPVGLMLTVPVTGKMLSKFSSRTVMLVGGVLFAIDLGLLGFCNTVWQLVVVLFFLGATRNLFNISTNAQAVAVQSLYDRSIMANFHGIWSLAGFAGAAIGYFAVHYGISTFYHLPAVSILLIICSFWFISGTIYQPPIVQPKRKLFSLPEKSLIIFALICFCCMACENTMYDWSGVYFEKVIHVSKGNATEGFVVYMIAMTLGRFVGDAIVNRFGIKNVLRGSGVLIFIGLLLSVIFPNQLIAALGFIMVGFGVSCVVPMVFQMAGRSKTMSSGTALASISSIGYLGFLLVPPFVGFVAEALSLRASFGLISLLGLMILFLVYRIDEEHK